MSDWKVAPEVIDNYIERQPDETQEADAVVPHSDTHDQIRRALDLQMDFNEARELLELCFLCLDGNRSMVEQELLREVHRFLDRTE